MNVIVHYPKTDEDNANLHKQVAIVHAQAVLQNIRGLSCPKEQKLGLLHSIINKRPQC